MSKKLFVFLICLVFLALFLTTSKYLLFYDSPEFFKVISTHTFFASLGLGHPPIRPIFMGIFWLSTHLSAYLFKIGPEYSANLSAFIFGIISILLFLKLSRFFLSESSSFLATLIFSFFPVVWILNTNLTVESLALTLFILTAILFMKAFLHPTYPKLFLYAAGVFLLVGVHIMTVFWLISFLALPLLLSDATKKEKSAFIRLFLTTLVAAPLSFLFYSTLFRGVSSEASLVATGFHGLALQACCSDSILRIFLLRSRNLSFKLLRGFGALIPFLLLYLVIKKRKDYRFLLGALIFFLSTIFLGSIWEGDFMIKRIAFVAVILALVLIKCFPKRGALLIIYLLPIFLFNSLLYLNTRNDMPLVVMKKAESLLPQGGVLVQTHYVRPFTYEYNGFKLWVGEDDLGRINDFLKTKKVFLDAQAVFAPYLLYVGNNFHITSLGKFGQSETQQIFPEYSFDLAEVVNPSERIFIYELKKDAGNFETRLEYNRRFVDKNTSLVLGTAKPGSPVYIYSKNFFQRIHRERIDYGDLLTWLWVVLSGRHEPMAWTYADKDGFFVYPISVQDEKSIYVVGPSLENSLVLSQNGVISSRRIER